MKTNKNYFFAGLLICLPFLASAQTPAATTPVASEPFASPEMVQQVLYLSFATVCVLLVSVVFLTISVRLLISQMLGQAGVEKKASAFDRLYQYLIGREEKKGKQLDVLINHEYDGIQELDNDLPPWFKYLFYLTISIGVVYMMVFHVFEIAPLSSQEYLDEMAQAEKDKTEYMKKAAFTIDENNITLAESAEDLAEGKGIFTQYCAACHGQLGEGKVGPNFTDKFWLHGGSINDLFKTIKYGVPEKGMISWQSQLNPRQMREVASYILTLQGTNPPNQKEAQGVEYIPASVTPADSTAVPVDSLNQTKP